MVFPAMDLLCLQVDEELTVALARTFVVQAV
jgi:hypothetical protein